MILLINENEYLKALTLYHVDDLVVGGFSDDPPRVDFDDDVILSDTGTIGRTARAYRLVRRQSSMLKKW